MIPRKSIIPWRALLQFTQRQGWPWFLIKVLVANDLATTVADLEAAGITPFLSTGS
jgi:hypothetical protein